MTSNVTVALALQTLKLYGELIQTTITVKNHLSRSVNFRAALIEFRQGQGTRAGQTLRLEFLRRSQIEKDKFSPCIHQAFQPIRRNMI